MRSVASRAVATAAVLLAGVLTVPAPAQAGLPLPTPTPTSTDPAPTGDPVPPTISSAAAKAGDPGILRVAVSSDSSVTEITATVTPRGGTEAAATVTSFHLESGQPEDGVWLSDRVALDTYGDYTLSVEARDADGDRTTEPTSAELDYRPQPQLTDNSVGPAVLDYDHRTLTARGTVGRFDPRTGLEGPWSGLMVRMTVKGVSTQTTTDDLGRYTVTHEPGEVTSGAQVPVFVDMWEPGSPAGEVRDLDHGSYVAHRATTRVVLEDESRTMKYGSRYTLAGTAEYLVDGAWQPLAGGKVTLDGTELKTTSDAGRFSFSVEPGDDATFTISLVTDSSQGGAFLEPSSDSVAVDVIHKVYLGWSTAWLNQYSEVHVQGQRWTSGPALPRDARMYLQQSSTGTGNWVTLGYLPPVDADGYFNVDAYVTKPSGYWRLYFPGGGDFQSAVSQTKHFSRIDTRFRAFNASPEPVRAGSTITLGGYLQKYTSGAWRGFADRQVDVFFRAKGTSTYRYLKTVRSGSTGKFTAKLTARKDGYWSVVWFTPNGSYVNAYSSEDYVDVR